MSEPEKGFIVHRAPIWRDRANFIINAELTEADRPHRFEQPWARRLQDDRFEICCIPFFLFDIALGDIVKTTPKRDRHYVVEAVVKPSGRYVFRIWLGGSSTPTSEIEESLSALGALFEWSSSNMLAVDARDAATAGTVAAFLAENERAGRFVYETGRS